VRAIDVVKIALETFGAPIYVRREIVHNRYVVNELAEKARFLFMKSTTCRWPARDLLGPRRLAGSAGDQQGASPQVIDATCPLVTKVHIEAVKFAKQGYSLVLIGHRDHDEIEGTLGEVPEVTQVVSNVAEATALEVPDPNRVAYLTQTTLSLDEARDIIHALKSKFPNIVGPHSQTFAMPRRIARLQFAMWRTRRAWCWWWLNQQLQLHRLVEVSRNLGTIGYLIDNSQAIDPAWLEGVSTVAVTAGASAPECWSRTWLIICDRTASAASKK